MIIYSVPKQFQPNYISKYPKYSSGKNMEELFYNFFKEEHENINTDLIYLPIFWTSYYVSNNYGKNINELYNWLESLDKTKKYFTIVQYATGIFVKNFNIDIKVFSAGGGGLNVKDSSTEIYTEYHGLKRYLFIGNKGDVDIPLICLPEFKSYPIDKDIYCSFIGRYDTHFSRIDMKNILESNDKFKFYKSENYNTYHNILNRSIFTLAPRGYGYTSFRIYEAILANSIPIYIWENKKIIPFNNEIKWEDFSIILHHSEINNLPQILEKCDIKTMQDNLKKIRSRFTFKEILNFICRNL